MNALEIRGLTKVYAGGVAALKGIDLTVREGEFFALLGPNGAGKSTTIGIITSLTSKTAGSVRVFGDDIDRDFEAAKRHIGLVPQEINFSQFETPLDIVVNQAGFYGVPRRIALDRAEEYLTRLSLWDKRNVPSRALSGGMKRRLMIARALLHEPRLLILDEPTAGVDIELRRSTWEFITEVNKAGRTIILTTHYLEEAESLCRDVAIIDKGKIIANTSMRALLEQLNVESFILDLARPLAAAPNIPYVKCQLNDPLCLEIRVDKTQNLNDVFDSLTGQGVEIMSLRNKSNRLEELFLRILEEGSQAGGSATANAAAEASAKAAAQAESAVHSAKEAAS